jgi:translation initiation factor IF-2
MREWVQVVSGFVRQDTPIVRVRRHGQVVWEGKLRQLKQVKQVVQQVGQGAQCGIMFEGWEDFQIGDQIEAVAMVSRRPKTKGTDTGAVMIDE